MKKITVIFLLAISFQNCFAQSTTGQKDEKVYDHYIGAQIGPLIMHLFNANANSIGSGNPYLITYSMNNKKTGWGIRIGVGYNSTTNANAVAAGLNTTNNTDMQLRAGIEKTFEITNKWTAGTGVDIVLNSLDDNSATNSYYQFDTTSTITKSKLFSYGGGVFGKVNYHLSNRILIGTEGSFYYVTGNKNQTVDVVRSGNNIPSLTTESKTRPGISGGTISLPIVVYLLLKF